MAPTAGLEPATSKLTASCSTIELRRNTWVIIPLPPSISQCLSDLLNLLSVHKRAIFECLFAVNPFTDTGNDV